MKYIGMDAHSSSCVLSVLDKNGVEIDNVDIQTNGRQLINYVRSIEGKKKMTFEECELSQWLYELMSKEVDELIVCNPVTNRRYVGPKTDKLDARRLAKLLRGGFLEGVYHDGSDLEKYRSLVSAYQDVVYEAVRLKNRYKSMFRKEGKRIKGQAIYNDESLLEDFERSDFKFIGEEIFNLLQQMEGSRSRYLAEIKRVGKGFREIALLKSIGGISDIRAAKIISQVIDPERFPTKYKYFSYCGLVRHPKESGGKGYGTRKGYGNKTLKEVYKMAGKDAIRGSSGFRRYYDALILKGVSEHNAYNAVCRKIAAVSLKMLKSKRRCDDKLIDNPIK